MFTENTGACLAPSAIPPPALPLLAGSGGQAAAGLPAAFGRAAVKSAAREPINPDRFAAASSGAKGVHYAHSQSRWLSVKQTVIEIFIREEKWSAKVKIWGRRTL